MDLNKKVKITTAKQFDKMVELLEQNPNLARGHSCGLNKVNVKEEWNAIGGKLNVLGPPSRTGEGWMKVWADYKFKIKKKLIHNKAECRATGGGSFKQYILSPSEESASKLLQIDTIINPGGREFGMEQSNLVEDHIEEYFAMIENIEPHTQKVPTKKQGNEVIEEQCPSLSTQKKNKKRTQQNELLEEQLKLQTALYTDVKRSLLEIERYHRKHYKLQDEKLKIYKNDLKRKEKHRMEFLALRKQELEIEKRRVEMEEIRNGF